MKRGRKHFQIVLLLILTCVQAGNISLLAQNHVLQIELESVGKTARVKHYQHYYRELPILNSGLTKYMYFNGDSLLKWYGATLESESLHEAFPEATHWYWNEQVGFLESCQLKYYLAESAHDEWQCRNEDGKLLWREQAKRYHNPDSGWLKIHVFHPNPVVSLNQSYGRELSDFRDGDSKLLRSALQLDSILLRKRTDISGPSTKLFSFQNISAPFNESPPISSDRHLLTRSDADFEFFNALFHLEKFAAIAEKKGYHNLLSPMVVDHDAMNGADQSAFNPYHQPPSLEFGKGGVDDAEDAQVVIHEMAHSLAYMAAGNSAIGKERKMMEEGICDFLAMYYSQKLHPRRSKQVFSWDGHNEFWDGFILNSQEKWRSSNELSMQEGRQIWSSCWNCIAEKIGWENAFELALESLFYFRKDQKIQEMAAHLLHIDSSLWRGNFYRPIKHCLIERNVLSGDFRELSEHTDEQFQIINSHGFSFEGEDLWIRFTHPYRFEYEIFNSSGKQILKDQAPYSRNILLRNPGVSAGICVIKIDLFHQNGNHVRSEQIKLWLP